MKTKSLISIAIIAVLPFGAMADYDTDWVDRPISAKNNGIITGRITVANTEPPYRDAIIENIDAEHIASTAYVKGAYNDIVAAINMMDLQKQPQLMLSGSGDDVVREVLEANEFMYALDSNHADQLITSGAVVATMDYKLNNKRVEVYTNWDNDNAKTQVEFVNAPAQQ